MEKKKKDQKLGSACNQESQTNELQNKQDKAQPNVTLGPNTKISSPSLHNAPASNQQQQPPLVQWSYTPPTATEQLLAISIPTQAPSLGIFNHWEQIPHPQQGQAFVESTSPFRQPQRPGGPLLGGIVPPILQTFTPIGMTDAGWQAHPVGCTFPGFPGPWDPSSWLGQIYQLQHPCVYNLPGALGFSSATARMPGCLASSDHSFQRGIIRPPAKLSQKHQQLWEAQSLEHVHLWCVINNLKAEVSDHKDHLLKLEEEVSSLKQKVEEPTAEVIGTVAAGTGHPSKRGRPKRSVASADALHESHPRARGRKPVLSKARSETKSAVFEKVIPNKVENKEIENHSTNTMAQQEINEKILNVVKDVSGNIRINQSSSMMSAYQAQVHQEYQGIQICGTTFDSVSGVKVSCEKDKDLKVAYSELSQPDKVLNCSMDFSAKYIGDTCNGSLGWHSSIPSQDSAGNVLHIAHQRFFNNGSFIQQEGKVTPAWNFANGGEDASEDLEDAIVGSAKDVDEEEMGDDTSSSAEEIGVTKDAGGCAMNNAIATSRKGLSPLNNW